MGGGTIKDGGGTNGLKAAAVDEATVGATGGAGKPEVGCFGAIF